MVATDDKKGGGGKRSKLADTIAKIPGMEHVADMLPRVGSGKRSKRSSSSSTKGQRPKKQEAP